MFKLLYSQRLSITNSHKTAQNRLRINFFGKVSHIDGNILKKKKNHSVSQLFIGKTV